MKRCLFIIMVSLFATSASAQTVHVINFCNTLDPEIGCDVDYERTNREAGLIAAFLNYNINFYTGTDEDCSNENLTNVLNSLTCGKDDIVIFYYSGHGGRSAKDTSVYPQLCLKHPAYQQDKWIPMYRVIEKLKSKGARFTLVLSDCCNKAQNYVTAKSAMSQDEATAVAEEKIAGNYRKLFLEKKGMVIVTSSRKGQVSWPTSKNGGLFSLAFFEVALYNACAGNIPASWEDVLGAVNLLTQERQEPYYEIKLTDVSTSTQGHTTYQIVAIDNGFSKELSTLLDNSRSEEWRLHQADYLSEKYFTSDAKVATVGRNGSTIIDYETVQDYLRRIAVSKLIKQINIIKETTDSQGKRNYIKVQEIRKEK